MDKNVFFRCDMGTDWVDVGCVEEISVDCIVEFAGRVDREPGIIRGVTTGEFEKFIKKSGKNLDNIAGFVVPVPECSGWIWKDEFEEPIMDIGDIYDILDEEKTKNQVRILYYELAEKYIISEYIEPICAMAKKLGKKIVFDLGKGTIHYDFIYPVNPINLINNGISVLFSEISDEVEAFSKIRTDAEVLLIKPVRGARAEYIHLHEKGKVRLENPALEISFQGTYYCEKLAEKNISFSAIDEYTLEDSAYVENGKIKLFSKSFDKVIICNGCMLAEMGEKLIRNAINAGVSVNSAELLKKLAKEEWED